MSTSTPAPMSIERNALYELVWQEPMTKIAPRFGLSDVGLAKACKRNNIPRPPVGYWAKKAVGKAPRRTPLPPMNDGDAKPITFLPDEKPKPAPIQSHSERVKDEKLKALIALEERPENKITVVGNPSKLHPFVRETKLAFGGDRRPYQGLYSPSWSDEGARLDITVSKEMIPRSLLLMDALIKAFEKRGHKVIFEKEQYRKEVMYLIEGEKFSFRLREKLRMTRIPESERKSVYGDRVQYEGKGILELQLRRRKQGSPMMAWKDHVKSRLEDQLNAVMIGMIVAVEIERDSRRRHEEYEAKRRADEIRRWEQQREREKEEAKIKELYQRVHNWEQAARIRAFVADVFATNEQRNSEVEEGSEIALYLEWAMKHADAIDPLGAERRPPSVEPVSEEWARPVHPR